MDDSASPSVPRSSVPVTTWSFLSETSTILLIIHKILQRLQLFQYRSGLAVQGRALALTQGPLQQDLYHSLADADASQQAYHYIGIVFFHSLQECRAQVQITFLTSTV